jgi:hypothetical protein
MRACSRILEVQTCRDTPQSSHCNTAQGRRRASGPARRRACGRPAR